jgi:phospholipase/carboxylesterase
MKLDSSSLFTYEIPPKSGQTKQIIFLLHGFAMRGEHMIRMFANYVIEQFPDAYFFAPNGPHECREYPGKYDWLRYDGDWTPENIYRTINHTAELLNHFIDQKLRQYNLTDKNLMFVGFSQGTRIALHTGLRRSKACAGILGYSGALTLPEYLKHDIKSYPKIKLIHGEDDQVVHVRYFYDACAQLKSVGVQVDGEVIPKLGHKINNIGIISGSKFMIETLK